MAFSAKAGSFTLNTSTGSQSVTGVGFTPKLLFLFGTPQTSDGYSAHNIGFYSFISGTGTEQFCMAWASDDNLADSNAGRRIDESALILLSDGSPTVDGEADFTSFDADGFTINITDAPSSAWRVFYLALGGTDLTAAKVLKKDIATGTGSESETGMGFQPDMIFSLPTGVGSAASLPRNETGYGVGFGAATATAQVSASWSEDDAAATQNAAGTQSTSLFVNGPFGQNAGTDYTATRTSLDADGVTISKVLAPDNVYHMWYLGLDLAANGRGYVGSDTSRTSTGTQDNTSPGFDVKGLIFWYVDGTARAGIGVSDGTNEFCCWWESVSGGATMDANRCQLAGKAIRFANSASTTDGEADSSIVANGYRLDWTDATTASETFLVAAFGEAAAATGPPTGSQALLGVGI